MRISDKQLEALGDYQAWKAGEDGSPTLLDYAAYTATPDQLFGYAALFFRALVEVEGHYFFADEFDAAAYAQLKNASLDRREIQRRMNTLRMSRLLQNADIGAGAARDCAQLVAAAWNEVHGRKGVVAEVHGETLEELFVTLVNGHE